MSLFIGLLSVVLFIILIVGLINPILVLKWSKKPTRIKVFGYWLASTILLSVIGVMTGGYNSQDHIDSAEKDISEGNYEAAITSLQEISTEDSLYNKAQILLQKADSLNDISVNEKLLAFEQLTVEKNEEKKQKAIEDLERELTTITKGIDFSIYHETIDGLNMELALFAVWGSIIIENDLSEDDKISKLVKQLKQKLAALQTKEFPIMRKVYAKIVANLLWENDIYVSASGTGKRYINFTGGNFAANANKKEFQVELHEILTSFRFKQSRYRWYKEQDEYTYYTIYEGKDTDLVLLNNE